MGMAMGIMPWQASPAYEPDQWAEHWKGSKGKGKGGDAQFLWIGKGARARQTIHARMQDAMASWRHFPMSRVSTVSLSLSLSGSKD